jgi:hypothetical protein
MKIKLDENLPASLAVTLRERGHDVDTVPEEGLQGRADPDVWQAAQAEQRFLITQDLDFSDVRRFQPGTHAGLLVVRLSAPGRLSLLNRIETLFASEPVETWQGSFVVLTDHKLRVRPAP